MNRKKSPARHYRFCTLCILFLSYSAALFPASLTSATWGFSIDPPEGYEIIDGDGKERFSFLSLEGAQLDIIIYAQNSAYSYASIEALAADIQRRLKNQGERAFFVYRKKNAAILQLQFSGPSGNFEGWGLCIELEGQGKPLMAALAYGPAGEKNLDDMHLSALNSIAPTFADRYAPGPIIEYWHPRGDRQSARLAGLEVETFIYEHDAEAAQALVDREFTVLSRYTSSPLWKEAWIRFYRAIYRDSSERLVNIAFILERYWNIPILEDRELAEKTLKWIQSFTYERNLDGSDFVNLVSAAIEGKGDCDSRAMLWAVILSQANIPASIMVSSVHSHAMGLADLPGTGARFELEGKKWLVAETTTSVPLGLIQANMSNVGSWIGVVFE